MAEVFNQDKNMSNDFPFLDDDTEPILSDDGQVKSALTRVLMGATF